MYSFIIGNWNRGVDMFRLLATALVAVTFLSGCAMRAADNVDPTEMARAQSVANAIEASVAELCTDPRYAEAFTTCEFETTITRGARAQALATARGVHVSEGMLRTARSDSELAFVIGHEAAHVVLGHLRSMMWRSLKEIELEADEYGLLFAMHAGYEPEGSFSILRKIEASHRQHGAAGFSSHPGYRERREALEAQLRDYRRQDGIIVAQSGLDENGPNDGASR